MQHFFFSIKTRFFPKWVETKEDEILISIDEHIDQFQEVETSENRKSDEDHIRGSAELVEEPAEYSTHDIRIALRLYGIEANKNIV